MTGIAVRHSILAGVDGSPRALHAVRWAAREAARRHVPLRLCHVRAPGQSAERGKEWLRAAQWTARDLAPGIELHPLSLTGHVPETLLGESAEAGLTVLGPGPLAFAVAGARSPVVVVRGRTAGEPPPDGGPVVTSVGAEDCGAAVEFAVDEAVLRGVPLVAVHARADPDVDADELLAARLSGWREKFPEVEFRPRVLAAAPAGALLDESAGAQLTVVGAGAAARTLLRHGRCPVAIVRYRD